MKQGSIYFVTERAQYTKRCSCGTSVDLTTAKCTNSACNKSYPITHQLLGSRYLIVVTDDNFEFGSMEIVIPMQQLTGERFEDFFRSQEDMVRLPVPAGATTGLRTLGYAVINQIHSVDKELLNRSNYSGKMPQGNLKELLKRLTLAMGIKIPVQPNLLNSTTT